MNIFPWASTRSTTRTSEKGCGALIQEVNEWLGRKSAEKSHAMTSVVETDDCPCGGSGSASEGVELIVLIDSSGSMKTAATIISEIARDAEAQVIDTCAANAKVHYLFVDGNDRGQGPGDYSISPFDQSHEDFLLASGASGPFRTDGDRGYEGEQGGKAIADLSEKHAWAEDHCRAILYISDERLDSINHSVAASLSAAQLAIATANSNNVSVFTHYIGPPTSPVAPHYHMMSDQTSGRTVITSNMTDISEELYVDILSSAICDGCGVGCATADIPDIFPCIHISWGESACDCMEGDDHEEVFITICNCYGNVTLRNVRISALVIVDQDGVVAPNLPDGSPSSKIWPTGPICFGDIGPCVDGEETCVSRDAMIINRGLPPGDWILRVVGLCFDVTHHYDTFEQEYKFTVCKN